MQLHRDRDKFAAAGAKLVLIGQGTPAQAADFKRKQRIELPLLVDPDRRTYKAAGAKKATFSELLGPTVVLKGIKRGLKNRLQQGRTIGHPAQLGGVLVVSQDGRVTWAHLADDASDNPPNETVLEAAGRATVQG
jgi:hypothetical protein